MSEQNGAADVAGPTLGELYRAWLAAIGAWRTATERRKAAEVEEAEARRTASELEGRLGAAALAGVERVDGYRGRCEFVEIGGRLFRVDESGNEADGWRYEVRPFPVRKLAV